MKIHIRLRGDSTFKKYYFLTQLTEIMNLPKLVRASNNLLGSRKFSTASVRSVRVAVLGASGGIGQPLSLLLKHSDKISALALYDIVHSPGVAADISHIPTRPKVQGYGPGQLREALTGCSIVVIPAGLPRKPGMSRDDLFKTNASIVRDLAKGCADACPKALIAIITNPVNSMVPIVAEIFKKTKVYDEKKIMGITTLDVIRASTFIGEALGVSPTTVNCPVICGHSGVTIIPLLSQCNPAAAASLPENKIKALTKRIQEAGTEVVEAKAGLGSATLSMAYAAARFTDSLVKAVKGDSNVTECTYVKSSVCGGVEYFATPVVLGKDGVVKNLGMGKLNAFEQDQLKIAIPELKKNIDTGVNFINKK